MPRRPKLRPKNGYWYSEAGGKPRYYGKIGVISYANALKSLHEALVKPPEQASGLRLSDLIDRFREWLAANRAEVTGQVRGYHLKRWMTFIGDLAVAELRPEHLLRFRAELIRRGCDMDYVTKHEVSICAMIRRAIRMGWMVSNPFLSLEITKSPKKMITEASLMTREEVKSLLQWADHDLDQYKGRAVRDENPFAGFADMLRVYHATGARTTELCSVCVGDYQPRTGQLLLGRHKRATTLRDYQVRQIVLNEPSRVIVERLCKDRGALEAIFQPHGRRNGPRWSLRVLTHRFGRIRALAGVRDSVTIYSFRHLWISDMLLAGVDVLLIARMAGTSVKMIEQVYGHFRAASLQDAQARLDDLRSL